MPAGPGFPGRWGKRPAPASTVKCLLAPAPSRHPIDAAVPCPCGAQDAVEVRDARGPAEGLARPARIGDQRGRVARPTRDLAPRNAVAGHPFGGVDHLAHAVAGAGTEIEL